LTTYFCWPNKFSSPLPTFVGPTNLSTYFFSLPRASLSALAPSHARTSPTLLASATPRRGGTAHRPAATHARASPSRRVAGVLRCRRPEAAWVSRRHPPFTGGHKGAAPPPALHRRPQADLAGAAPLPGAAPPTSTTAAAWIRPPQRRSDLPPRPATPLPGRISWNLPPWPATPLPDRQLPSRRRDPWPSSSMATRKRMTHGSRMS
jgi:hypothetical protein